MKTKWKKWQFWRHMRDWCNRRMTSAWMEGGNCDSCCPRCKQWESHGNTINTESLDDGSEQRTCSVCGQQWKAVFGPAGFMPIGS